MRLTLLTLPVMLALGAAFFTLPAPPETAAINDNTIAAGTLDSGVARIALEVSSAAWYPEKDGGPHVVVHAFGERGKAPSVPGPMIRVRAGTTIQLQIRNTLPDTVTVFGLVTRPATADSGIVVRPGATRKVAFAAGQPGTYYYWGTTTGSAFRRRRGAESQLSGAFVIDSAGTATDDRVFLIGIWNEPRDTTTTPVTPGREVLVINGKSWPHTERIEHLIGDSIQWRWINASHRVHPMHLHGYYYGVHAKGDARVDTTYGLMGRRLVVTEELLPGRTMSLGWKPPFHPGNWLFHCHLSFHVSAEARLEPLKEGEHDDQHMAGLVLGITVRDPEGARPPPRKTDRTIRFVTEPVETTYGANGIGVRLGPAPAASSPGAPLIVHQNEAVDVRVVNRLDEPTSIHWHGLELDSYSDGVPNWSSSMGRMAHPIAAGDSFTAQLSLLRAGTFLYHTHLDDVPQLVRGLYGPIIVLEPSETYDPKIDHLFLMGWAGQLEQDELLAVMNGDTIGPTIDMGVGETHRLRLMNIAPRAAVTMSLQRADSTLLEWTPYATDGATLPSYQQVPRPARYRIQIGQTADFLFTPRERGEYRIAFRVFGGNQPDIVGALRVR